MQQPSIQNTIDIYQYSRQSQQHPKTRNKAKTSRYERKTKILTSLTLLKAIVRGFGTSRKGTTTPRTV